MECNRCGKDTDYYYKAGPVVLCENCACNSVAALADEGLFPFFDSIVSVQPVDAVASKVTHEEPVSTETARGWFADYAISYPPGEEPYADTYAALDEENPPNQ